MKLLKLLDGVDCKIIGSTLRNVNHLTHIAQDAKKDSVFFSLKGKLHDGNNWIDEAINNKCRVIVTESSIACSKNITQIIVPDARKAISQIAANFFDRPAEKLKIVGVTGTNGKTTTTTMIAHILKEKHNVAIIGTNGAIYGGKKVDTGFTTPDPIALQQLFADMVKQKIEYVVMEMSAHAIYLKKLFNIHFEVIAFTNLSQDHLDYFENMENYFAAKEQIFKDGQYNAAVVCVDTAYGQRLKEICQKCITCSVAESNADIFIKNVAHTTHNQSFDVISNNQSVEFNINLLGKFNLQNAIVAISVCHKLGYSLEEISTRLISFVGVAGRFESYEAKNCSIIIDYAHTPDGLYNLLMTAKDIASGKLYCVFGCGGNRDRDKRPIMASVAEKFADYTFVTTDNPRFEDNYEIAMDIVKGFSKKKWEIILDRGQAIREAIKRSKKGDIVVIAGKGAENYIDVLGTKIEYSDTSLVKKIISKI